MSLIDKGNRILSNWYLHGGTFLHGVSSFAYDSACYVHKLSHKPAEERIEKLLDQNASVYKAQDREKIKKDIERCWMKYGYSAEDYFMYHIYEADEQKKEGFISAVDTLKIASILNDREEARILTHKYRTYELFKEFYKREVIRGEDLDEEFIRRHPRFIVKDDTGSRGVGIYAVDIKDFASAEELIAKVRSSGNVVCEEMIKQDPRLAAFHPASVNTVKVRTLRTVNGKIVLWASNFRTGQKNSVIDNSFMGGPACLVDQETGIVLTDGCAETGVMLKKHPDSGLVFKGFQLPEWEQAKKLVLTLAEKTEKLSYVGWDIALSKEGWIMVEGNSYAQMTGPQKASLKPMKKELWDIVFER